MRIARVVISVCLLFGSGLVSAHPLLNVPLDDPMILEAYAFVDRMGLKYGLDGLVKNRRPYTYQELGDVLDRLEPQQASLTSIEREHWRVLRQWIRGERPSLARLQGEDYRFDLNFEPGLVGTHRPEPWNPSGTEFALQLRPTLSGGSRDDFAFLTDLRFYLIPDPNLPDTVRVSAVTYHREARYSSAGLSPGYAKFRLPWFEVLLGRETMSWGPGRRGNLLLSTNPYPMDMFQLRGQFGSVGAQTFTAIGAEGEKRKILSAHRLEVGLWDWGTLGINEVVVFAKEKFDVAFLNPFMIYTASHEEEGSQGNLLVSGDLEIRLGRRWALYGEVLIDDFQPRYGLRSFLNRGSKFGIQLGAYWVDPLQWRDTDVRFEYAFLNQYVYTHQTPVTTYTHEGRLIGHPVGTDADDWWLQVRHWFTPRVLGTFTYELQRHGEGDVTNPGEVYHPARPEDIRAEWEFLSGTREITHALAWKAQYHVLAQYLFGIEYTFFRTRNVQHQQGVHQNRHQLVLQGRYRF